MKHRWAGLLVGIVALSCAHGARSGGVPGDACQSGQAMRRAIRHAPGPLSVPNQLFEKLDPGTYPQALCNDGTPGAYWFRPGTGEGQTRWIIYLEDGKKCLDNQSCMNRAASDPPLVTSNGLNDNRPLIGALSPDPSVNPTFYDANAVLIHYCSSDYWSGGFASGVAYDPTDAQDTWNFEGRAIAEAVMQDLQAQGLSQATDVLLSGSAAGGLGIVLVANDLIPMTPPAARVLIMDDAGYAIDIPGFDPTAEPPDYLSTATATPSETTVAQGLALWRGRGDLACTMAAQTPQAASTCMYASVVTSGGWLPVPVLTMESQIDSAQMMDDGWYKPNKKGSPQYAYSQYFGTQMAQSLLGSGAANSIFAPYKLIHNMTNKNAKFDMALSFPGGPMSPEQGLAIWYAAPCSQDVWLADPD